MNKTTIYFPGFAFLILLLMLVVSSWVSPGTIVPLLQVTLTDQPVMVGTPTEDSWVIVDLPPDATQLEYGAEVYRLVCKACHGDKGQGLTDDWRAQWNPRDQNCWQSKCHALNHPPDGFYMPIAPAVVGPPLVMFETALELYNYNSNYMPWHDKGSLTDKENWSVTAYLLKINNVDPGTDLNAQTAGLIRLRKTNVNTPLPRIESTLELPQSHLVPEEDTQRYTPYWVFALLIAIVLLLLGLVYIINRRSDS